MYQGDILAVGGMLAREFVLIIPISPIIWVMVGRCAG